ncbi:hypothetical protein MAPG_03509 [Magnaporthiopsis poae ATCC 64411]|uniref:Clr5 domain-containing protein n=1 Tax=Magnaporthiopsis poae (strain ATCC 64411 / 73-15) TaxID=644358 RepID=A0A0C4DU73_MAGP6|nr:hypothetical protein MAPG_03509 [Magnaporthiopsis poae ATCC 64411]
MEPNGPAFSRRCWEERRETIVRLYQAEDCDFKTLVEIMKSNGFSATRREYMKKLKQWGIHKNVKADEYAAIVRIQARRQAEGKQTSFRVRKRPVSQANISRYLRRSRKNESLRSAVDAPTPPFVEYGTPVASPSSPAASFDRDCEFVHSGPERGKSSSLPSTPDAAVGDSGRPPVGIEYTTPERNGRWVPVAAQDVSVSPPSSTLVAGLAQYDECIRHCPYQARFLATFLSIHARHPSLHRAQAVVFDYVRRVLRRRLGAQWPDHPLVRIVHILYLATRYHASSVVHDPAVMLFLDDIYDSNSSSSSSDNIPAATTSVRSGTVDGEGKTPAGMSQVRRWEWTFFALRAHFDRVADCTATGDGGDGSSAIRSLRRRLAELHQGIAAEQNPPFDSLLKLLIFIAHKGPAEMHLEPLYVHLIQQPRSLNKIVSCIKDLVGFLWGDWTDGKTRFHYLRALVIALWRFEHSYTMMADGEAAAVLRLWRLPLDAWLGDNKGEMEVQGNQPPAELRRLMDRPKGS